MQQLIDEGCGTCTLRHQAQLEMRDYLRRQRGEEAAQGAAAPLDPPE